MQKAIVTRPNRSGSLVLLVGVLVGALAAAAIRHLVYVSDGWQPNVHPGMAYYAFPVLALPLALLAMLVHIALRRSFAYAHGWQWLLAGFAYGLWFLAFLGPVFFVLVAILNPLAVRLFQVAMTRVRLRL